MKTILGQRTCKDALYENRKYLDITREKSNYVSTIFWKLDTYVFSM